MKPKLNSMFCLDAASAPDVQRLCGPATGSPPSEWGTASPHELDEPWTPTEAELGPTVEEWDEVTTGHTGYSAGSKSWKLDLDLPNGWYTRIVERG